MTRHRHMVAFALMLLAGCAAPPPTTPLPPLPTTIPAPPGSGTQEETLVEGTLWIHGPTGVSPVRFGDVRGWITGPEFAGWSGPAVTDESGRYRIRVPVLATRIHVVGGSLQPCASSVAPAETRVADTHVVKDPSQVGANIPAVLRSQSPTIAGMVHENVLGSRRPLANALVWLDAFDGLGVEIASTATDDQGRYILCGIPPIRGLVVGAALTGYGYYYSSGDITGLTSLDIELRPQR